MLVLTQVSPSSGPTEGGTVVTVAGRNLATTRSEITNVTIGGAVCRIRDETYQPGVQYVHPQFLANVLKIANSQYFVAKNSI